MIRRVAATLALALAVTGLAVSPASARPDPVSPEDALDVYSGVVDAAGLEALTALGIDRRELTVTRDDGGFEVKTILSGEQAAALAADGVTLESSRPDPGFSTFAVETSVFRPYSGAGGIQQELLDQAAAHPAIAEAVTIGQTVQGQDLTAVRVTRDVARVPEGSRPATVYLGTQHAREWITPEMVRRLLDRMLDGYGTDRRITRLIDSTELWFIPVANPDGYDYTFQSEDTRLWRKNLRDVNGDGAITSGDGVDLNRNYPTKWGYDDEGSSPNPASEVYRGDSPGSEPETQAIDDLFASITPQFLINYHSAAELLLYGQGWQVATPTPDDVIYEAMAGDDADPAVPGYDPDISAELYTTNGETDGHVQEALGTLAFTPEMTTCETVSDSVPDDEWEAEDCRSGFNFPDDEELIAAEFEKNVPFALAVGESARDPDDPVSVTGLDTPDFLVDGFSVSYGDPQPVAVAAKKSNILKRVEYRINGGPTRAALLDTWGGGERYGADGTDYYAEYRGLVRGAKPGDSVEVWFSAYPPLREILRGNFRKIQSERFTYTLASDTGNSALVIADEDYTGVNPTYPAGTTAPKYLTAHVDALAANGVAADTWDVDAQGVPHDLGVLAHYDTVLWYLGDNRLTQDPEDELTEYGPNLLEDASVAETQQYLTLAVRDFLNEGGQLVLAGETAGYTGVLGGAIGGIYYGLDGAPDQPCAVTVDPTSDCLLVADDFVQYYLGGYARNALGAEGVELAGGSRSAAFGGPAVAGNPVDEAGAFTVTSDVLPVDEYPLFASEAIADYTGATGAVFPVEGDYQVSAAHADDTWFRLARTVDMTDVADGASARFEAALSYDTEEGYDNVIVEARTAEGDDWTTLADLNGGTSDEVPADCEQGFYVEEHPRLADYLTVGDACEPTGRTGEWNAFTGSSGGWQEVAFDLSAYAGSEVELVVSYVTDPSTGGAGVALDDTRVVVDDETVSAEGFEEGLGPWDVLGAPAGSPEARSSFDRTELLGDITAAVGTDDTVLLGFGLEQLATDADRAAAVGGVLRYLRS